MTFRYLANLDVIEDEITGHRLDRPATERLLDRWQGHHDELLRVGSVQARMTARDVRRAWLDLDLCRPSEWIAESALERPVRLEPITLRVVVPSGGWVVTPGDADHCAERVSGGAMVCSCERPCTLEAGA